MDATTIPTPRRGDLLLKPVGDGGEHVVKDPRAGTYFNLPPQEAFLLNQLDGQALRFKLKGPDFDPVFVESFRVDSSQPGSGFDSPERLLVPTEHGLRAYGRGGRRLMAGDPARDLSQQSFGIPVHVRRQGDRLFVLDSDRQTLWTIPG